MNHKRKEGNKEEVQRMVFGIMLWLITWLLMASSSSNCFKGNFLETGLIVVESEDINVSLTTTKVINSTSFNDENGEPHRLSKESTKVVKVITKIIVKDRDAIWEMVTKSIPNSVEISSEKLIGSPSI